MHPMIQPIHSSLEQHFLQHELTRAHCDESASVQATDTDSYRYLYWLLHTYCSQRKVHPDTRSSLTAVTSSISRSPRVLCFVFLYIPAFLPRLLVGPLTPRRAFTGAHAR